MRERESFKKLKENRRHFGITAHIVADADSNRVHTTLGIVALKVARYCPERKKQFSSTRAEKGK